MRKLVLRHADCLDFLSGLSDESVDLVVADPPYWKVLSTSWDYQWRTRAEYFEWCQKWLRESVRVLRQGGSLYLFGYFRVLAHLSVFLEAQGLEVKQQVTLTKGLQAISGRATKKYKMYPVETETVVFAWKDSRPFVRKFLLDRQRQSGLTSKDINTRLGVKTNGGGMWSFYTGNNIDAQVPTEEAWRELSRALRFKLPYRRFAQTFNIEKGLTDVWPVNMRSEERLNPAQKPLDVLRRLVRVSSNPGDLVVDPFLGSGTTAVACMELGRDFMGADLDPKAVRSAQNRLRSK